MAAADTLAPLAAEYHAMSAPGRRRVLRHLNRRERDALERLAADLAGRAPSAWLARRCEEARNGDGPLTDAVRRTLLSCDESQERAPRPRGPSLASRFGALLGASR